MTKKLKWHDRVPKVVKSMELWQEYKYYNNIREICKEVRLERTAGAKS